MANLSICIPTYNRADLLAASLRKLLEALRACGYEERIEVCVSDNGSEDHTSQVLARTAGEFPALRYRCNDSNLGFGRNLWNVVEFASSDHVLLSGDDDAIDVWGLSELISVLHAEAPDLLLLNSESGNRVAKSGIAEIPGPHHLSGLRQYLADLGPFHATFIGNLVFRRSAFLAAPVGSVIGDSAYPHLVPVLNCLSSGRTVFLPMSLIRSDDCHRSWRVMQPIYTSIDLAQIYRRFGLPGTSLRLADRLRLAIFFARSLPRAWWAVASGALPSEKENLYRSIHLRNVVGIYAGLLFPMHRTTPAD